MLVIDLATGILDVMSGLKYEDGIATFSPGIADIHAHPRVFDPITDFAFVRSDGYEGKAGVQYYTATALKSGIVLMGAMPNEAMRIVNPEKPGGTELVQFPISNLDRARVMESSLATQSYIKTIYYLGIDRTEALNEDAQSLNLSNLRANFMFAGVNAAALKLWADISTGGQNIPPELVPEAAYEWHKLYPHKPIIIHAEDQNVRAVLEGVSDLADGQKVPIHIAHVSSREELEAVIWAKELGMNVTCEVTPHHLFVTEDDAVNIGGYGCMKPTLKSLADMEFLRANLRYIDMFASDCAPHKPSEKEAASPTFGVTNHTTMMHLFLGAVDEGWLTLRDLYNKMVLWPRRRFNLPISDLTTSAFDMRSSPLSAQHLEEEIEPRYGQNIMCKLEEIGKSFHLLGKVVNVESGSSWYETPGFGEGHLELETDLRHLVKVK